MNVSSGAVFGSGPDGYREEFLYAVEVARALHDPATDWDGFRDALWDYMRRVFGIGESDAWPTELPSPDAVPAGDARAVAAWIRDADHVHQRSAATPRG